MYRRAVNAALLYTYAPRSYLPAGAAAGHVWVPDAETRAIGERANVVYNAPQHVEAFEQLSPSPAMLAFKEEIVRAWPGVYSGGIVRDSARRANANSDPHRSSSALDAMLRATPERAAQGDALANFLVRNAEYLGIQYVLWSNYEWSASRSGARWERYTGADPHLDHVHTEPNNAARAWPASVMRERVRSALAAQGVVDHTGTYAILAGTAVAGAAAWWAFGRR